MVPGRYRFLLAVAAWFVPRQLRAAWRRQRERELWHWRSFLIERDEYSPEAEAEMIAYCWRALQEAVGERLEPARLVRGPGFCVAVLIAAALVLGFATGGLRATRAVPRPLPYPEPARVVTLSDTGTFPGDRVPVRRSQLALWQQEAEAFEGIAAYSWRDPAQSAQVEPDFFNVLRVKPALGRFFVRGETSGAVISYALWEKRFRRDPAVVGHQVSASGRSETILGVLPREFWFIRREIDVWTPLTSVPERVGAVGRLKPGYNLARGEAEMRTIILKNNPPPGTRIAPHLSELQRSVQQTTSPFRTVFLFFAVPPLVLAIVRRAFLNSTTRYELFFAVKVLLVMGVITGTFMEIAAGGPLAFLGWPPADRDALTIVGFFLCSILGMVWCFHDQRRRCRHCLEPLSMPTSFGTHSSWLLDPAGTELLCDRGHGTLYVPDSHTSTQKPEGWTALDNSWRDLFDVKK